METINVSESLYLVIKVRSAILGGELVTVVGVPRTGCVKNFVFR